jgi:hypothetical protein
MARGVEKQLLAFMLHIVSPLFTDLSNPEYLEMQEIVRFNSFEAGSESWLIGSKQKELAPKAFGMCSIVLVLKDLSIRFNQCTS